MVPDPRGAVGAPDLGLRPLTARSVMASVLLGTHPPALAVKALIRVGDLFGIAEGTTRVALSRMVADGELVASDGQYRLGPRLAARQVVQDQGRWPETLSWSGAWEIIIAPAAEADGDRERAAAILASRHLAAAGGRTWLRPANLNRPLTMAWPPGHVRFEGRPATEDADGRALAASLWDLETWQRRGAGLLAAYDGAIDPAARFVVAAGILRHLRTDPLLPDPLLPEAWAAGCLRTTYERFVVEFNAIMVAARPPLTAPAARPGL